MAAGTKRGSLREMLDCGRQAGGLLCVSVLSERVILSPLCASSKIVTLAGLSYRCFLQRITIRMSNHTHVIASDTVLNAACTANNMARQACGSAHFTSSCHLPIPRTLADLHIPRR